jgi:hypothetical protein
MHHIGLIEDAAIQNRIKNQWNQDGIQYFSVMMHGHREKGNESSRAETVAKPGSDFS